MMTRKVTTAGLLIWATTCLSVFASRSEDSFSLTTRWKSERACKGVRPCIFTFDQIFDGDWDRIIVFDMTASQEEIDATIGKGVARPDLSRLIVFMRKAEVVKYIKETQGIENSSAREVVFSEVPVKNNHLTIPRDAKFVKASGVGSCSKCVVMMMLKPGQVVE